METTIDIEKLSDLVANKLFRKLKGEDLVNRDREIWTALGKPTITAYKLGKLKILGIGYHSILKKIKEGEFTKQVDYDEKDGKIVFFTKRVVQRMNAK